MFMVYLAANNTRVIVVVYVVAFDLPCPWMS